MEGFKILGAGNFLSIQFEEVYGFPRYTCNWEGYEVRTSIEIKSKGFTVKATLWTSTGEIFQFFQDLEKSNDLLQGIVYYRTYEDNLDLKAEYNDLGHVTISGSFTEHDEFRNVLKFEFLTDQSYLKQTVQELKLIASKYGGMEGKAG